MNDANHVILDTILSMGNHKPFTEMVRRLNRSGTTYYEMQKRSGEARSTGWFNQVANGYRVNPPPDEKTLDGLAELFQMNREAVAELVAEEWYGVRRDEPLSERTRRLAPTLDQLDEGDAELIAHLAHRLAKQQAKVAAA